MDFSHISYSELRENLKSCIDQVCADHAPLLVTRRNGKNVVLLSEEDYSALEETAYLLRSPANAKRLLEALTRAKKQRIPFDSTAALAHALDL